MLNYIIGIGAAIAPNLYLILQFRYLHYKTDKEYNERNQRNELNHDIRIKEMQPGNVKKSWPITGGWRGV